MPFLHQRPNRTEFYRFEFGSVRLRFLESSSGSVRFGFIFGEPIRVRFGSSAFLKIRFEFGSVRFEPNRTVIIRLGSVRFRSLVGLLTAFGSLVEFLLRLLLYVFQQRLGVPAGMRRIMEKTIGINRITEPTRIGGWKLPCHLGILDLRLYEHPWLVVIFMILYLFLPVIAVASIALLSYFRISITSLTYIILITFVLVCLLGLLWVMWEENEIGRIIPGAWEDISDVLSPLKKSMPLLQQIVPKEDLDKLNTFADHAINELKSHIDGLKKDLLTRANNEFSLLINNAKQAVSSNAPQYLSAKNELSRQLTGSAQDIRERKVAEQLKDVRSKVFRKS